MEVMKSLEYLYHYYDGQLGPFKNLSDLSMEQAQDVLGKIKAEKKGMAAYRSPGYLERRRELEQVARKIFVTKGGKPIRQVQKGILRPRSGMTNLFRYIWKLRVKFSYPK